MTAPFKYRRPQTVFSYDTTMSDGQFFVPLRHCAMDNLSTDVLRQFLSAIYQ